MSRNTQSVPPSLADLTLRFVNRPIDAAAIEAEAGALGEVEPHEVAVGFRADPRLAWQEGLSALEAFELKGSAKPVAAPSEWAGIVVRHESAATQPFALASYPQRVRDLSMLLQADDLAKLKPAAEARPASPALVNWADKQIEWGAFPNALQAVAVLRAAHDYERAAQALNKLADKVPEAWRAAFANEEAALLWQQGSIEKAAAIWAELPESPVVLFNRGMAALFTNKAAEARENLRKAIEQLPENDGWHHLASLYLALAEMRS